MTMRSPIVAMLWEIWRLTRLEAAWRLALGIVGGLTVLAVFSSQRDGAKDFSAAIALTLIVMLHFVGWLSMSKLTAGGPAFRCISSTPVRCGRRYSSPSRWRTSRRRRLRSISCQRFS